MKNKDSDDKKQSASYLHQFRIDVQSLNNVDARYHNLLMIFQQKIGKENDKSKLYDQEQEQLHIALQEIRYIVRIIYISYKSIANQRNIKVSNKVEKSYEQIMNEYIINRKDLNDFTIEINNFLLSTGIDKILKTSEEILNNMYDE